MNAIRYLLIAILFSVNFCRGFENLEQILTRQTEEYRQISHQLDSLQLALNKYSRYIEQEKQRKRKNSTAMADWYDQVSRLSQLISERQGVLRNLRKEILKTRSALDTYYSIKIDSLQKVLDSTPSPTAQKTIDKSILNYSEKRISLLPPFKAFTFDPQKVSQIDLDPSADSLEQAIYLDYLNYARREVSEVLGMIEKTGKELREMAILQKRSERFLEEIGDDRPLPLFTVSTSGQTSELTFDPTRIFTAQDISLSNQAQSLFHLFDLLKVDYREKFYDWVSPQDSGIVHLSMNEYLQKLNDAQKLLKNYLKTIDQKMK